MKNKVLFIKVGLDGGWYIENHLEYLQRYLGDEFYIDINSTPYPPFDDFLDRLDATPQMRSPEDYDLVIPVLGTHWHIDKDQYRHKVGIMSWEGMEGHHNGIAVAGATNPQSEQAYKDSNIPYYSIRMGIDTELFKPFKQQKPDNLQVGLIGNFANERHRAVKIMEALRDVPGVDFVVYAHRYQPHLEIEKYGGMEMKETIKDAEKSWIAIPTCYNRLDVLVRVEQNEDYGFPVLEAAACGVPVVATDWGNCPAVLDAGGGITIKQNIDIDEQMKQMVKAVIYLRDHPTVRKTMGRRGRKEIEDNWTWPKQINNWKKYLREGIKNARETTTTR